MAGQHLRAAEQVRRAQADGIVQEEQVHTAARGGQGDEAAELLSKAVTLRPEVAETRFRLAYVFETLKKDQAKSLETLRELKVAVEKGRAKAKSADLVAVVTQKIRTLEQALKAVPVEQAKGREPAQKKGG